MAEVDVVYAGSCRREERREPAVNDLQYSSTASTYVATRSNPRVSIFSVRCPESLPSHLNSAVNIQENS